MLALLLALLLAQESVDSALRLGLQQLKDNQLPAAVASLELATRLAPRLALAWLGLADAHLRQGLREAALADARRAEALAGSDAASWKAVAFLARRTRDSEALVRALETLIRLDPRELPAYLQLANLRLERREDALTVTKTALARFPQDAELLRLHGLALYAIGKKPEAIDTFLRAMDAAPESDLVHASIETLLPEAGDRLPQIRGRLERFAKGGGPLGPFLLALAVPEQAKEHLQAALARDPQFWPAWFELSKLLPPEGRKEALEKTLSLNPNHEGAHFALAKIYLDLGDKENARLHRLAHHRLRSGK